MQSICACVGVMALGQQEPAVSSNAGSNFRIDDQYGTSMHIGDLGSNPNLLSGA